MTHVSLFFINFLNDLFKNFLYFIIFELKDKKFLNKSFKKLMKNNETCVWTIISKTLNVNDYNDIYFKFK